MSILKTKGGIVPRRKNRRILLVTKKQIAAALKKGAKIDAVCREYNVTCAAVQSIIMAYEQKTGEKL